MEEAAPVQVGDGAAQDLGHRPAERRQLQRAQNHQHQQPVAQARVPVRVRVDAADQPGVERTAALLVVAAADGEDGQQADQREERHQATPSTRGSSGCSPSWSMAARK